MEVTSNRNTPIAVFIVAVVVGLFGWMLSAYYVPAYNGTDENGYLCSARRIALTGSPAKFTSHPLEHVSGNVVQVKDDTFYAKYPLGYPWLCAIAYRLAGPAAAFWVNPILAALALVGIFLLARSMIGAFAGVLAAILLATNPMHATFGLTALSHAGAICFAVWSMYFLWRWLQHGGAWNAALAGGLAAYTYAIRYSEALLAIPVVAIVVWRYVTLPEGATPTERIGFVRQWRREILALIIGVVVCAGPMWLHHWIAFGAPWKNGYDLCGESTGFGWKWFQGNWWTMLTRLNTPGLLLLFPLGAAGLAYLAVHDPKRGIMLALWVVPSVLIYTAYYWAPVAEGRGYVRFFVSVFPGFIIGALALLTEVAKPRPSWSVAVGIYVAIVATFNLRETFPSLANLSQQLTTVATTWDIIRQRVPEHSTIVAPGGTLNNIEYAGTYELYSHENFDRKTIEKQAKILADTDPHPFQRDKARALSRVIGDKSDAQLIAMERSLLASNIAAGRMVVVVGTTDQCRSARGRLGEGFRYDPVTEWYQVSFGKEGEPRPTTWTMYQLQPAGPRTNTVETVATLEEKVDHLQFRARQMRDEYDAKFPSARQEWEKIQEVEKQLRDHRDRIKILQSRKPATNLTVRATKP